MRNRIVLAGALAAVCAGCSSGANLPPGQSVKDPTALKYGMPGLQPGKQVPGAPKGLLMPPSAARP
jgi:hypothetical protein